MSDHTFKFNDQELMILTDAMDMYISEVGCKSSSLVYAVLTDL